MVFEKGTRKNENIELRASTENPLVVPLKNMPESGEGTPYPRSIGAPGTVADICFKKKDIIEFARTYVHKLASWPFFP